MDSAQYLKTDADIAEYLDAIFEDGDPELIRHALGDVARAKGMAQIAKAAGVGRESLYKALSAQGNPEFATVLKELRARSQTQGGGVSLSIRNLFTNPCDAWRIGAYSAAVRPAPPWP